MAAEIDIRPTKQRGQNFVIDPNTVRKIVREAGLETDDIVVEVGPGLGSLTLALLEAVGRVVAIDVDPVLAAALPGTIARFAPDQPLSELRARARPLLAVDVEDPSVLDDLDTMPDLERMRAKFAP